MRILFVGSVPDNDYDRSADAERARVKKHKPFFQAVSDLGRTAAARGHTLMVGSDRKTTIDHHVVRKGLFPEALAHPKRKFFLDVYRPRDAKRPFESDLPTNVCGDWQVRQPGLPASSKAILTASHRKPGVPLWLFAHQSAIASADVVIAAGGTDGTSTAVHVAKNLGVPVIPLASFGGGAGEAFDTVESTFADHPNAHHLTAEWPTSRRLKKDQAKAEDRAQGIIQLAEAIGLHSYFLSHSHQELEWCDLVQLSLYYHERNTIRDFTELRAGKPVQKTLYEAIGRAETFVLLWNRHAAKSQWCDKELKVALKLNKAGLPPRRIVLFMKDKTPLPKEVAHCLALDVRTTKQMDSRVRTDRAVMKIVAEEKENV